MASYPSDIAFTPAVKAVQAELGSRATYTRMEQGRGWATQLSPRAMEFIRGQDSFFLATVSSDGQPYIQHRGGPVGFLRILDGATLAFADFAGNRQYITVGNLTQNDRVHLFLIDFNTRRRIKIWGTAAVTADRTLLAQLTPPAYRAVVERGIVIKIHTWDENCPQHIPQRFDAAAVEQALAEREHRIAELQQELDRYKSRAADRVD
jgi:uncharacterized protein